MYSQNKFTVFFALFALAFAPMVEAAQVHPGGASGSVQYFNGNNTNATFGGLVLGTINGIGGTVTNAFQAANTLYQATNALIINPQYYGATCDAQYFDGRNGTGYVTLVNGSPTLAISGHTFSNADIGKSFVANAGTSGDAGLPLVTIIAVNTGNNTATMSASPTVSTTSGYGLLAHDDTTAFHNASFFTLIFHGSYIIAPNNCAVRGLTFASDTTLMGQSGATGYGYGFDIKPVLNILESGFASDTTAYGINISGNYSLAIKNLEIRGITFPYLGFSPAPVLACIGTTSGNTATAQALLLDHVTISYCPVGLGVSYGTTPGGYIFLQTHMSEFASNGIGMNGNFSDWLDEGSTFTGNFTEGVHLGPIGTSPGSGGASHLEGTRFEENGTGFTIDSGYNISMEGVQWQFNNAYALYLLGSWREISVTGGMMQGNGTALASGNIAHIGLGGVGAAGHLHLSNVTFDKNNFSAGGTTHYLIDGITSGTNNPDISIVDGTVANGYSVAEANWEISAPTALTIATTDNGRLVTASPIDSSATFPGAIRGPNVTLTSSGGTFTPVFATGNHIVVPLVHGAANNIANPATLLAGQSGTIEIIQSATGGDTVGSWGTKYRISGGTSAITLSSGTNAVDIFSYKTDGSFIELVGPSLNLAH